MRHSGNQPSLRRRGFEEPSPSKGGEKNGRRAARRLPHRGSHPACRPQRLGEDGAADASPVPPLGLLCREGARVREGFPAMNSLPVAADRENDMANVQVTWNLELEQSPASGAPFRLIDGEQWMEFAIYAKPVESQNEMNYGARLLAAVHVSTVDLMAFHVDIRRWAAELLSNWFRTQGAARGLPIKEPGAVLSRWPGGRRIVLGQQRQGAEGQHNREPVFHFRMWR